MRISIAVAVDISRQMSENAKPLLLPGNNYHDADIYTDADISADKYIRCILVNSPIITPNKDTLVCINYSPSSRPIKTRRLINIGSDLSHVRNFDSTPSGQRMVDKDPKQGAENLRSSNQVHSDYNKSFTSSRVPKDILREIFQSLIMEQTIYVEFPGSRIISLEQYKKGYGAKVPKELLSVVLPSGNKIPFLMYKNLLRKFFNKPHMITSSSSELSTEEQPQLLSIIENPSTVLSVPYLFQGPYKQYSRFIDYLPELSTFAKIKTSGGHIYDYVLFKRMLEDHGIQLISSKVKNKGITLLNGFQTDLETLRRSIQAVENFENVCFVYPNDTSVSFLDNVDKIENSDYSDNMLVKFYENGYTVQWPVFRDVLAAINYYHTQPKKHVSREIVTTKRSLSDDHVELSKDEIEKLKVGDIEVTEEENSNSNISDGEEMSKFVNDFLNLYVSDGAAVYTSFGPDKLLSKEEGQGKLHRVSLEHYNKNPDAELDQDTPSTLLPEPKAKAGYNSNYLKNKYEHEIEEENIDVENQDIITRATSTTSSTNQYQDDHISITNSDKQDNKNSVSTAKGLVVSPYLTNRSKFITTEVIPKKNVFHKDNETGDSPVLTYHVDRKKLDHLPDLPVLNQYGYHNKHIPSWHKDVPYVLIPIQNKKSIPGFHKANTSIHHLSHNNIKYKTPHKSLFTENFNRTSPEVIYNEESQRDFLKPYYFHNRVNSINPLHTESPDHKSTWLREYYKHHIPYKSLSSYLQMKRMPCKVGNGSSNIVNSSKYSGNVAIDTNGKKVVVTLLCDNSEALNKAIAILKKDFKTTDVSQFDSDEEKVGDSWSKPQSYSDLEEEAIFVEQPLNSKYNADFNLEKNGIIFKSDTNTDNKNVHPIFLPESPYHEYSTSENLNDLPVYVDELDSKFYFTNDTFVDSESLGAVYDDTYLNHYKNPNYLSTSLPLHENTEYSVYGLEQDLPAYSDDPTKSYWEQSSPAHMGTEYYTNQDNSIPLRSKSDHMTPIFTPSVSLHPLTKHSSTYSMPVSLVPQQYGPYRPYDMSGLSLHTSSQGSNLVAPHPSIQIIFGQFHELPLHLMLQSSVIGHGVQTPQYLLQNSFPIATRPWDPNHLWRHQEPLVHKSVDYGMLWHPNHPSVQPLLQPMGHSVSKSLHTEVPYFAPQYSKDPVLEKSTETPPHQSVVMSSYEPYYFQSNDARNFVSQGVSGITSVPEAQYYALPVNTPLVSPVNNNQDYGKTLALNYDEKHGAYPFSVKDYNKNKKANIQTNFDKAFDDGYVSLSRYINPKPTFQNVKNVTEHKVKTPSHDQQGLVTFSDHSRKFKKIKPINIVVMCCCSKNWKTRCNFDPSLCSKILNDTSVPECNTLGAKFSSVGGKQNLNKINENQSENYEISEVQNSEITEGQILFDGIEQYETSTTEDSGELLGSSRAHHSEQLGVLQENALDQKLKYGNLSQVVAEDEGSSELIWTEVKPELFDKDFFPTEKQQSYENPEDGYFVGADIGFESRAPFPGSIVKPYSFQYFSTFPSDEYTDPY